MKKKEYKKIEDFINGQLSGDELHDFMSRLQNDPQLLEKVEAYQASILVLQELKRNDLKDKLKSWDKEAQQLKMNEEKNNTRIFYLGKNIKRLSIAASFLLLIALAGILFIYLPQSASSTFAQLQTPAILAPDRSISNAEISQLNQLELLYFNGDYESLIETGTELKFEYEKAEISRKLLIADAHYHIGKNHEALNFYTEILALSEIDQWYKDEAEWRALMIRLEMKPFSQTLHMELQNISERPNHLYRAKAEDLLQQTQKGPFRWAKFFGLFE